MDEVIRRLDAALPVDDLVAWLLRNYPDVSEGEVLGMVQRIYREDYVIRPAATRTRAYEVGGNRWDAVPQRVERRRS